MTAQGTEPPNAPDATRRLRAAIGTAESFSRSPYHGTHALCGPLEVCETHISWVVLAGDYAYKIKKPVRFDFLDYSTLERRRAACEVEVELNRRWAPDLYLGVSTLVDAGDGLYFDADGTAVEYAVRMRRFPRSAELDFLLSHGNVTAEEMRAFGTLIAQVHARAPACPLGRLVPDDVLRRARQTIDGLRALLPSGHLQNLERWLATDWERVRPLLAERCTVGRVIECHGDLHCGNVVRLASGLVPFDGIDFDPALRFIDAASDIAFLIMDLQSRNRCDLAAEFLTAWLEGSRDYGAAHVLPFFVIYRALVRALIGFLRAQQLATTERRACEARASRYLELALDGTRRRCGSIVLMHGLSGSGKSVISGALVSALPAVRIRADEMRRSAAATTPPDSRYAPANVLRTYREMAAVTRSLVTAGFNVVVDATFLDVARRLEFAALGREVGAGLAIVSCVAPTAILEDRIRTRHGDPSEATVDVLAGQIAVYEALQVTEQDHAVIVHTATPTEVSAIARDVLKLLHQQCGTH